ncbi:MAG: hypothetical protein KDB82_00630 [Planctomycetes bacterium]|nr:hypothetical protein [Planctomycetota bacterium]
MATRQAKRFKIKVHLSLRYILRFHQDDAEFEAECIDAATTGLGATQQEALQDLIINLNALHKFSSEEGGNMLTEATKDDERTYARLAAGQPVDPSVLGYGVVRLVELIPAGQPKAESQAQFEIGQHTSFAA